MPSKVYYTQQSQSLTKLNKQTENQLFKQLQCL